MREFTETEKQWLRDNYHSMKQCDCAKHLHCSGGVIRRLAKQLGIYEYRKSYDQLELNKAKKVEAVKAINQDDKGYCLDCCYYLAGGHCSKTGRDTGALNKKICFKETEE